MIAILRMRREIISFSSRSRVQSRSTLRSRSTFLSLSENFSSETYRFSQIIYSERGANFPFFGRAKKANANDITTRVHSLQRVRVNSRKEARWKKRQRKKERKPRREIKENDKIARAASFNLRPDSPSLSFLLLHVCLIESHGFNLFGFIPLP